MYIFLCFRQTLERDISDVNNVEDSVTYTQIRKLYFDEDQSKDLKESDTVTIVNPVLLVRPTDQFTKYA